MKTLEQLLSERDTRLTKHEEYRQRAKKEAEQAYQEKIRNIDIEVDKWIAAANRDYETAVAKRKERKEKPMKLEKEKAEKKKKAQEQDRLREICKEELHYVTGIDKEIEIKDWTPEKTELWDSWKKLRGRFQWLLNDELWPIREDLGYVWDAVTFVEFYNENKDSWEKVCKTREKKGFSVDSLYVFIEKEIKTLEDAFTDHKQKEQGKGDYKNVDTMNGLTDLLEEDEQLAELEQYEQNVKELEQELDSASVVSSLTQVSAPPANDTHPAEVSETIQNVEPPKESVSVEQPKTKMPTVINLALLKKPEPVQEQDRPKIISNTKQKKPLTKGSAFAQFFHH